MERGGTTGYVVMVVLIVVDVEHYERGRERDVVCRGGGVT